MKFDLNKCRIGERLVKFLEHMVSKEGCKPEPLTIKAIKYLKMKEVADFLECVDSTGNASCICLYSPHGD